MNRQLNRPLGWITFVLCMGTLSGCGAQGDVPAYLQKLTPVVGSVSQDGSGIVGAMVTFVPVEGQEGTRAASCITDDLGNFKPVTPIPGKAPEDTAGVAVGKYKIIVSKFAKPDGSPLPPDMTEADAMAEGAVESIPAKYSDYTLTELTADITASDEPLRFEISIDE